LSLLIMYFSLPVTTFAPNDRNQPPRFCGRLD